jgi:hypothetical protein
MCLSVTSILFTSFLLTYYNIVYFDFSHWIRKREDKIVAKGKGELVTYWLVIKSNSSGCQSSRSSESGTGSSQQNWEEDDPQGIRNEGPTVSRRQSIKLVIEKTERLIDWNADILCRLLQQIMVCRGGSTLLTADTEVCDFDSVDEIVLQGTTNPFDEVKEIIALPPLNQFKKIQNTEDIHVPKIVVEQLRNYVSRIAAMYNNNQFHNFEHVRTIYLECRVRLHYCGPDFVPTDFPFMILFTFLLL